MGQNWPLQSLKPKNLAGGGGAGMYVNRFTAEIVLIIEEDRIIIAKNRFGPYKGYYFATNDKSVST